MAEAVTLPRSGSVLLLLTPFEATNLRAAALEGIAEVEAHFGGRAAQAVQRCVEALHECDKREPVNSVFNLR
jgi:hypothetical protein